MHDEMCAVVIAAVMRSGVQGKKKKKPWSEEAQTDTELSCYEVLPDEFLHSCHPLGLIKMARGQQTWG